MKKKIFENRVRRIIKEEKGKLNESGYIEEFFPTQVTAAIENALSSGEYKNFNKLYQKHDELVGNNDAVYGKWMDKYDAFDDIDDGIAAETALLGYAKRAKDKELVTIVVTLIKLLKKAK